MTTLAALQSLIAQGDFATVDGGAASPGSDTLRVRRRQDGGAGRWHRAWSVRISLARRDSDFLVYQTEDGRTGAEVRLEGDPARLTLVQIAEQFQRDKCYRFESHPGTHFCIWANAPSSPAVRNPRAHRTGPRGAFR